MNGNHPLACDMTALSSAERTQHHELVTALVASIRDVSELPDGYRFMFDTPARVADLGAWIALEIRCCPFLRLTLDVGPGPSVSVTATGTPGVREFLATELGLQNAR